MADDTDLARFQSEGTRTPDALLAGDFPRETLVVTITGGAPVVRGTVLGRITASGKYLTALAAANDGSQTPKAILAMDCDATGGDVAAPIFLTGEFNEAAVTIGAGLTLAGIRDGLRQMGIFLRKIVAA